MDRLSRKLTSIAQRTHVFANATNVGTGIALKALDYFDTPIVQKILNPDSYFCLVNFNLKATSLFLDNDNQTAIQVLTGRLDVPRNVPMSVDSEGWVVVGLFGDKYRIARTIRDVDFHDDEESLLRKAVLQPGGKLAVALRCLHAAKFDFAEAQSAMPGDVFDSVSVVMAEALEEKRRLESETAVGIAKGKYGMRSKRDNPKDLMSSWYFLNTCKNTDAFETQEEMIRKFVTEKVPDVSSHDAIPLSTTPGAATAILLKTYSDAYSINYKVLAAHVAKKLGNTALHAELMNSQVGMHGMTASQVLASMDFTALRKEAGLTGCPFPTFEHEGESYESVVVRCSRYIDLDGVPFHERPVPFNIYNPQFISTSIETNVIRSGMFAVEGGVTLVLLVPKSLQTAIYMEGATSGMHAGEEEVLFREGSVFQIDAVRFIQYKGTTVLFGRVLDGQSGGGEVLTAPVLDVGDLSEGEVSSLAQLFLSQTPAVETAGEPWMSTRPLATGIMAHGGGRSTFWANVCLIAVVIVSSVFGNSA